MSSFFFFNDTATTEIYTLSLHDALPISQTCHYHVPDTPETPTGHNGTTCWTRLNHLPSMQEPPARLAGPTCRTRRNHLLAMPEPLAGLSGITCRACWTHLSNVPKSSDGDAQSTCRASRKQLLESWEPPAGPA